LGDYRGEKGNSPNTFGWGERVTVAVSRKRKEGGFDKQIP